MKLRRNVPAVMAGLIVAAGFAYAVLSHHAPVLTTVTWSGAYGRAQASALFEPYAGRSGVNVHIAQYDGGLDELRAGRPGWDVIDMELPDAIAACREGLLAPVDVASLPLGPQGQPAKSDFVPGALGRCWVGSVVYSQAIAYAPGKFAAAPQTLADFFDPARFPGPRALHAASAKYNLEIALLADGTPPGDVYKVLATPQGLTRAFAKLDTIRAQTIWWTRSSEPAEMLADGRAVFATILNGDIHDAAVHGNKLGTIWDRQLYELDVFAIPAASPKRAMAMDFIRFATSAPSLAQVAEWVPYGPARRSAVALVGRNPELGTAMQPFLPTAHFGTAFAVDDVWWQTHGAEIAPRWREWQSFSSR
ncbi:MAG: extracellular solute-binding protein [Alphaproteobacteria bacterium]|nr:extracellular solute-binding protein [Alphaproteobacteria bacterium]